MSVKDRCVGPHEQVLNILIVCWRYGPSKPMYLVVNASLALHYLLHWLVGERNGAGPAEYSVELGVVSGALVSQERRICPTQLMTMQKVAIRGPIV
jgi:hypothetical protein